MSNSGQAIARSFVSSNAAQVADPTQPIELMGYGETHDAMTEIVAVDCADDPEVRLLALGERIANLLPEAERHVVVEYFSAAVSFSAAFERAAFLIGLECGRQEQRLG